MASKTIVDVDFAVDTAPLHGASSAVSRDHEAKMKAFFASSENKILYPVGYLLAYQSKARGCSYAQLIAAGETVRFPRVRTAAGVMLDLAEPLVVSLDNVSAWGCIVCGSAHGTRYSCSNSGKSEPDYAQIAQNKFYFNPATKRAFVLSDTCWREYVLGISTKGATKGKRVRPSMESHFRLAPVPVVPVSPTAGLDELKNAVTVKK